jgi:hypothetical protein
MDQYDLAHEIMNCAHSKGLSLTDYLLGLYEPEANNEMLGIVNNALEHYAQEQKALA